MSTLRIASIFALAAALAACGGSSDSGSGGDDTGTPVVDSGSGDSATHDSGTDSTPADSGVDAPKDSASTDSAADSTTTDSTSTDSTATDSTSADSTSVDSVVVTDSTTTDTATDTGPAATAWWHSCTSTTTCAAPTGETGFCATVYGQPECAHTCDGLLAYSLCEGGAGMCVPTTNSSGGTTNVCVKKCGDIEKATCGAGAACGFLGYRANTLTDGGTEYDAVGACVPDCATSGADACAAAGTACDPARKACEDVGCPSGCPTGSSCAAGSSYCIASAPTALYGACTNTATTANGCTSNLCFGEAGASGFCSIFCDSATGSVTCGTGGVCWYENNLDTSASVDSGTIAYPEYSFSITGDRSAGACLKTCSDTADCPAGFYCAEANGKRACVPGAIPEATPSPGAGLPGDVCHASGDCASGSCGKAAAYVDGICLKATAGAACPTGTTQNATVTTECDKNCDPTADNACAGSLVCVDNSPGTSTCSLGLCRENSDCTAGNICDHATSTCKPTASTGGSATGNACTLDTTCSGAYCIKETTSPSAWPGGYCSEPCTVLPDLSDTCTNGTICSAARMGELGLCLKLCDTTAPFSVYGTCRAGYKCQVLGDPAVGYCTTT